MTATTTHQTESEPSLDTVCWYAVAVSFGGVGLITASPGMLFIAFIAGLYAYTHSLIVAFAPYLLLLTVQLLLRVLVTAGVIG